MPLPENAFNDFELIITADGSASLYNASLNETYHSKHGAIQESNHVFIEAGFQYYVSQNRVSETINILEVGFGSGLNALLTYLEVKKNASKVNYTTLEAYPLSEKITSALNYEQLLNPCKNQSILQQLHICDWEKLHQLKEFFSFQKIKTKLQDFSTANIFDIVYYDAFAPEIQPELWSAEIFKKLYMMMSQNALLVTYCAKGQVRRNMQQAGFVVERLPGPPGKREILRALKL